MNKYALLGTYDTRNNVEVIALSDNTDELKKVRNAIDKVNELLMDKDRDEPNDEAKAFIEKNLSEIDIVDKETGYVHEIETKGIVELKEVD